MSKNEYQVAILEKLGKEFNIEIDVNTVTKMTKEEIQVYLKQKEEELFNNLFNTKIQD